MLKCYLTKEVQSLYLSAAKQGSQMAKIIVSDGMSWCSRCKRELPQSSFHLNKKRKCDGYCRKCRQGYYLQRSHCPRRVIPPIGQTYCGRCKTIKDNNAFSPSQLIPRNGRKVKRSACCRACIHSSLISMDPPKKHAKHSDSHQCFKKSVFNISSDKTKLAYVAGIVDAEGTVSLRSGGTAHPVFAISNNSESILNACQSVIGGSIKFLKRMKKFKNGKMALISSGVLVITSLLGVRSVCSALLPYLILKRYRSELVIKASFMPPVLRRELIAEVRSLNKKGISESKVIPKRSRLSFDQVKKIADEDIAYLAGMLDGDGWIGFRFKVPYFSISVTKSCIPFSIQHTFGGRIHLNKRGGNRADKFTWAASFSLESWRYIMPRIAQYLVLKKKHAELALKAIDVSTAEQIELCQEMKHLTKVAHNEKFERTARCSKNS